MTHLHLLWLPILLSSVIVFIVSSIIHMLSPWHKNDYPKLSNQDKVMDALRPLDIPSGEYMIPRPSNREEMRSPEFAEKLKKGPVHDPHGLAERTGADGNDACPLVSVLCRCRAFRCVCCWARVASRRDRLSRFPVHWCNCIPRLLCRTLAMSIWYHRPSRSRLKATVDGLIYALLTAGVFGVALAAVVSCREQ